MRRVKASLSPWDTDAMAISRRDYRLMLAVVRAAEKAVNESRSMGYVHSATGIAIVEAVDAFNTKPRKRK